MAKRQKPDKNSREFLENRISTGRGTLLMILLFTLVNLVLLMADFGIYFLFSASLPYYGTLFCLDWTGWNPGDSVVLGALAFSAVVLAVYLLCWIFSRKGGLIAATVLFILDTLALLTVPAFFYMTYGDILVDLLFHIWAVVELIQACTAAGKLRRMQQDVFCATAGRADPENF